MVKLVQSANALLPKSIFLYLFIFTVFKEEQFLKASKPTERKACELPSNVT